MNEKAVLITGASKGLGFAIASRLAEEGYRVIASARSESDEITRLIADGNGKVAFEKFDLSETGLIKSFVKELIKKHGKIYGLINNAALGHDGVLATMHESQISDLIKVNVEAPILLTKYISRSMLLAGEGRIINISSIIANTGFNGLSVYAASKASMVGFTKSLSRELGKANITVNCIAPGYMKTGMTSSLSDTKLETIIRRSPMKKLVMPDDVAYAASFLLNPQSGMVNGTTITVDSGSTA